MIDFEKKIWPKFNNLLRKGFNQNAQAICPNILPFFAQLSYTTSDITEYQQLVKEFFDNLKQLIIVENAPLNISKQDTKIIVKTYLECLRYLIQKIYAKNESVVDEEKSLILNLLEDNIVAPLKYCLSSSEAFKSKIFFQYTSTLVAFFDKQSTSSELYKNLLDQFWCLLFAIITEDLQQQDVTELYLERVVDLINDLYVANPSVEEHKVKFAADAENDLKCNEQRAASPKEAHCSAAFIQKELKQLVTQLLRICLSKTLALKTSKYMKHVRLLCSMFNDKDFFAAVSEDTLETTLFTFISLLNTSAMDNDACEILLDVIFEILQKCEKVYRFKIIENELLKVCDFY